MKCHIEARTKSGGIFIGNSNELNESEYNEALAFIKKKMEYCNITTIDNNEIVIRGDSREALSLIKD